MDSDKRSAQLERLEVVETFGGGAGASAPRMKSARASSTAPFGLPCLTGRTSPVARFSRAHVPAAAIPIESRAAA
jgi:hypothetical protein